MNWDLSNIPPWLLLQRPIPGAQASLPAIQILIVYDGEAGSAYHAQSPITALLLSSTWTEEA